MHTGYKMRHYASRALLSLLGPADLDEHNDPREILKRDYATKMSGAEQSLPEVAPQAAVAAPRVAPRLEPAEPSRPVLTP